MVPRCDLCGRFTRVEIGGSWVNVPDTGIPGQWGDERERCKRCTELHGPAVPFGNYIGCNGVYEAKEAKGE